MIYIYNYYIYMFTCIHIGACSTVLKDYFQDGFSETMTASILKEVLKAVSYLHSNNLVHK